MKVLTFSRQFPKGHPKAGQPTWFVERILNVIHPRGENGIVNRNDIKPEILPFINDFVLLGGEHKKPHTIRHGSRFKVGEMASLRVWSDKPYHSKQIEFAQVEVKKVWAFTISDGTFSIDTVQFGSFHPFCTKLAGLAKNDGLEVIDFVNWFVIHPKKKEHVFTGQIICWDDSINY